MQPLNARACCLYRPPSPTQNESWRDNSQRNVSSASSKEATDESCRPEGAPSSNWEPDEKHQGLDRHVCPASLETSPRDSSWPTSTPKEKLVPSKFTQRHVQKQLRGSNTTIVIRTPVVPVAPANLDLRELLLYVFIWNVTTEIGNATCHEVTMTR